MQHYHKTNITLSTPSLNRKNTLRQINMRAITGNFWFRPPEMRRVRVGYRESRSNYNLFAFVRDATNKVIFRDTPNNYRYVFRRRGFRVRMLNARANNVAAEFVETKYPDERHTKHAPGFTVNSGAVRHTFFEVHNKIIFCLADLFIN